MNRVFAYPIVVGPESIDVMKHTNNKEYLRWMEEAATAHSSLLGWNTERYFKNRTRRLWLRRTGSNICVRLSWATD